MPRIVADDSETEVEFVARDAVALYGEAGALNMLDPNQAN